MDLKKKKVIAREFLLFLICIIIGLLTYGGMHSYNFIKKNKVTKLNHQLKIKQAELDSLRESINLQVDEFGIPIKKLDLSAFDEAIKEGPFKEFGGETTLPPPPPKKYATSFTKQISSMQKKVNTIWFQREENAKAILINSKINQKVIYVFLICISLLFGLRYLWYAVNWSIKVLKS